MTADQSGRRSEIWVWMLVCLLAMFLVLAVLVRIARGDIGVHPDDDQLCIVS